MKLSELSEVTGMRMLSDLFDRAKLAARAGISFGGKRDIYEVLGYDRNVTPEKFRARYDRDPMAARIVEAMPMSTWRGGGELIEDENPDALTAFETAWDELAARLDVWPIFQRADILAGLGRFSVILIGAPGDLTTPLVRASAEQIVFLMPFAEDSISIDAKDLEQNASTPRFGRPNFYKLKMATNLGTWATQEKRVHYSRVLHISDGLLDSIIFSSPRLLRCWNRLDDLDKLIGGGSEAFWIRANQGTQIDVDPEIEMSDASKAYLAEQADEYQHGIRRLLRTRGVKINQLGSDVANFDRNADTVVAQLSVGSGIPVRILTGSERGELASTQDRNNWNQRVQDRRMYFADPYVVRAFVNRLIDLGALPKVDEYEVRWPEIEDLDDAEKAALAKEMAEINKAMGETVVLPNEIRDRVFGWEALDVEEIDEEDVSVDPEDEDEEDEKIQKLEPKVATRKVVKAKKRKLTRLEKALINKRFVLAQKWIRGKKLIRSIE